jgi:hypothetical protein
MRSNITPISATAAIGKIHCNMPLTISAHCSIRYSAMKRWEKSESEIKRSDQAPIKRHPDDCQHSIPG